jgi:hypothetical protein
MWIEMEILTITGHMAMAYIQLTDEGYSRNLSSALNLISTFLLH